MGVDRPSLQAASAILAAVPEVKWYSLGANARSKIGCAMYADCFIVKEGNRGGDILDDQR